MSTNLRVLTEITKHAVVDTLANDNAALRERIGKLESRLQG